MNYVKYLIGLGVTIGTVLTPMYNPKPEIKSTGSWLREVSLELKIDPITDTSISEFVSEPRIPPLDNPCWEFGEHGRYADMWKYHPKLGKCCSHKPFKPF